MKTAHQMADAAMQKACSDQGGAIPEGSSADPNRHDEIDQHQHSGHMSAASEGVGNQIPANEGNAGTGVGHGNHMSY